MSKTQTFKEKVYATLRSAPQDLEIFAMDLDVTHDDICSAIDALHEEGVLILEGSDASGNEWAMIGSASRTLRKFLLSKIQ